MIHQTTCVSDRGIYVSVCCLASLNYRADYTSTSSSVAFCVRFTLETALQEPLDLPPVEVGVLVLQIRTVRDLS